MSFADSALQEKYERLGFKPQGLGMELQIGTVKLNAVEHPWKGVVIILTQITRRSMCQSEFGVSALCSVEQIAGLIYLNFKSGLREDVDTCKRYFESVHVEPFPYDPAKHQKP